MPFVSIRALDGPLWIAGPREATPPGTLRRGRGLALIENAKVARSRSGASLLGSTPAIPLARFSGITLARDFVGNVINSVTGAPMIAGLTGHQGHAIAPSVADNAATAGDFFYYASATAMRKLSAALVESRWGINPPAFSPIGTSKIGAASVVLDALDSTAGWSASDITSFGTSSTVQLDGTSVTGHVAKDTVGEMVKTGLTLNLEPELYPADALFPGSQAVVSGDSDWISFGVRFQRPRRIDSLQLIFGCDNNFNSGFSFDVLVDDRLGKRGRRSKRVKGVADIPSIKNDEQTFKATTPGVALVVDVNDLLGESVASAKDNTWAILKIPKLAFTSNGEDPDWTTITAIKFVIRTNRKGGTTFYLDDLKIRGGIGMQGTYQYHETFKNSVTGHRSNSTTVPATVENVERHPVLVSSGQVPSPPDSQVDTREFWRTLGNGEVFFKLIEVPIGTTSFTDTYADFAGFGSGEGVLGDEELPTDNAPPLAEYGRPIVHQNRMWWATGRRAYYSPPGRYESVAGFVDVTDFNDGIVEPVRWDDQLFLLTTQGVYVVLGTEEPFLVRKIPGIPGVLENTYGYAAALPQGIVYQTSEGPRLLRGSTSQLLDPDGLAPFFQEHRTGLEGFVSSSTSLVKVTPAGDRVYLAYGGDTLVYDFTGLGWRDLGLGTLGGFHRVANGMNFVFLGHSTLGVIRFGQEDILTDAGAPIAFAWEPAPVVANADRLAACVRYVAFTINTAGQLLTPTIIVDDVEVALPPFSTTSHQVVEYPINRWGRIVGPRLTGSLTTGRVEIAEVAFDVYLPETHGIVAPTVDVPTPEGARVQPRGPEEGENAG